MKKLHSILEMLEMFPQQSLSATTYCTFILDESLARTRRRHQFHKKKKKKKKTLIENLPSVSRTKSTLQQLCQQGGKVSHFSHHFLKSKEKFTSSFLSELSFQQFHYLHWQKTITNDTYMTYMTLPNVLKNTIPISDILAEMRVTIDIWRFS